MVVTDEWTLSQVKQETSEGEVQPKTESVKEYKYYPCPVAVPPRPKDMGYRSYCQLVKHKLKNATQYRQWSAWERNEKQRKRALGEIPSSEQSSQSTAWSSRPSSWSSIASSRSSVASHQSETQADSRASSRTSSKSTEGHHHEPTGSGARSDRSRTSKAEMSGARPKERSDKSARPRSDTRTSSETRRHDRPRSSDAKTIVSTSTRREAQVYEMSHHRSSRASERSRHRSPESRGVFSREFSSRNWRHYSDGGKGLRPTYSSMVDRPRSAEVKSSRHPPSAAAGSAKQARNDRSTAPSVKKAGVKFTLVLARKTEGHSGAPSSSQTRGSTAPRPSTSKPKSNCQFFRTGKRSGADGDIAIALNIFCATSCANPKRWECALSRKKARSFAPSTRSWEISHRIYKCSPPNQYLSLMHWRVLLEILSRLSPAERENFKTYKVNMTFEGLPIGPSPIQDYGSLDFIDSHAHLDKLIKNKKVFSLDEIEGVLHCGNLHLSKIVANYVYPNLWQKAQELQRQDMCERIAYTFGIHPHFIKEQNPLEELKELLRCKRCIGLGEIGLDYSGNCWQHPNSQCDCIQKFHDSQKKTLREVLPWAKELNKTLVKPWSHQGYVRRAGCLRAVYGRKPWRSQDHLAGASRSWPQP